MPTQIPDAAVCLGCGYSLRGLPGTVCPECGRQFDVDDRCTYRVLEAPRYEPPRPSEIVLGRIVTYWGVGLVAWLLASAIGLAVSFASGWVFPTGPVGVFLFFALPGALLIVTVSTVGTALGLLVGPSETQRQRVAGWWVAAVLGLSLPWSSYRVAAHIHADLGLAMSELAFTLLVIPIISFIVAFATHGVWWLASHTELRR